MAIDSVRGRLTLFWVAALAAALVTVAGLIYVLMARALYNRIWIDHFPQGEKDTVKVFALWEPASFGVFADQNHWRVELERFRCELHRAICFGTPLHLLVAEVHI